MPRYSLGSHADFFAVLEECGAIRDDLCPGVEAFQDFDPSGIHAADLNADPMDLLSRFIEHEHAGLLVVRFEQRLHRYDLNLARALRGERHFRDQSLHESRSTGVDLYFNGESAGAR